MAEPLQHRFSNSSDDSPLQGDPSDNEHDISPVDDRDDAIELLDPRNSQLSLVSGAGHSLDDRRFGKRHEFDGRSLTRRDFFKYLVDGEHEAKKLRKILRAALDRLDSETRRAQEAERRALEVAQRFKIVNDARVATQQELEHVHAELRMYKVQLDNAQREILRGSDSLKDMETQRDNAEAAAARARSMARKLKEEQLMMRAKEEGRREGYQEGLRRGYQQARGVPGLDGQQIDVPPAGVPPLSSLIGDGPGPPPADDAGRTDPLDGLSMMNLSTPPAFAALSLAPPFGAPPQDGAGAQGSRFREIIGSPSTMRSAPLQLGSQAGAAGGWSTARDDDTRYIRPTAVHNAPSSPQHVDYSIPPDGYIPTLGADNVIAMPPPHELYRPPSASTIQLNSAAEDPRATSTLGGPSRDLLYPQRHRTSPRSLAESLPSTTISQFDLVSSPKTASRGLRDRSSGLSAIPEVSSSMEFSPSTEGGVRSTIIPEPVLFPLPDDVPGNETIEMTRSRSRELNQRIADELRYSDPELMEQWRRSTASQSHPSSSREMLYTPHRPAHVTTPSPLAESRNPSTTPSHRRSRSHSVQSPPSDGPSYLGAGSSAGNHRRTASSTPISIRVESPSGPSSNMSPHSIHRMQSPDPFHQTVPQPAGPSTPTPDRPRSGAGYGGNAPYGYPSPSSQSIHYIPPPRTPVAGVSPSRTPEAGRGYPVYPTAAPNGSSSSIGRPRAASADYNIMNGFQERSRTPSGRPPSVHPGDRPPSARPISPGQSSIVYANPTPHVPAVLRSPSRASSRQSLQQDPARPPSRASADHHRSLSLHAGSTPAMGMRPLSGASQIRRVPSASSINSETSRKSGGYQRYERDSYVDPAFLASSEDLTSMQSPNTMANTRANAVYRDGPSRMRPSSPSMSYASFRS